MNGTRKARPLPSSESVHSQFTLVGAMYGTEWLYFPKLSGARRLAQPRGWGSGGCARGYSRDSHHAGWHAGLPNVASGVSGWDLPGKDLGGSIPGADTSEASWGDYERSAAGTTGGPADPHYRRVHPVSWRA